MSFEFDRERLGDISGLRTVHLQCHIGTDTLSLARLGRDDVAAWTSRRHRSPRPATLAARAHVDIDYREANVYDAVEVFGAGQFDLVYTGVGALCWLPDIGVGQGRRRSVAPVAVDCSCAKATRCCGPSTSSRPDQLSVELPYFEQARPASSKTIRPMSTPMCRFTETSLTAGTTDR